MNEPDIVDAQRHRLNGRPCCPIHGAVGHSTAGQPTPISIAGKWFVLYDGFSDADPDVSSNHDGLVFEQLYICGSGDGKHLVRVYRAMDRKPWPGRAYQLTPGKHASYYYEKTKPLPVVTGDMRYPVVEALLRRLWGLQAITDKKRAQRHSRKAKKVEERVEAMKQRRKKMVPPVATKPLPRTKR